MEYCIPYNSHCIELPPLAIHNPGSRSERSASRLLSHIAWLFTPEPSDEPRRPAVYRPPTWKGSIKGLFWIATSIGVGMLLALVCS